MFLHSLVFLLKTSFAPFGKFFLCFQKIRWHDLFSLWKHGTKCGNLVFFARFVKCKIDCK